MGLLLLRTTLGATLLVQSFFYLFENDRLEFRALFLGAALIVGGTSLIAGFLTPVSAFLICLGKIFFAVLPIPAINFNWSADIYVIAVSAAILLLGPGAFSFDAKMFGRREIIIPEKTKPPK